MNPSLFDRTKLPVLIAGTTFGALTVGGIAYAAIPADDGTVSACYATSSSADSTPRKGGATTAYTKGDLRAVAAGEACRPYETPIVWNQKGLQGDTGATGATGATGPMGATGPAGAPGGAGEAWLLSSEGSEHALQLPAGSYTVAGTVGFFAAPESRCTVWRDTEGGSSAGFGSVGVGASGAYTLPIGGAFTLANPADVWVECTNGGSDFGISPSIVFTAVGTLHGSL